MNYFKLSILNQFKLYFNSNKIIKATFIIANLTLVILLTSDFL